jgi:hypothetical protein
VASGAYTIAYLLASDRLDGCVSFPVAPEYIVEAIPLSINAGPKAVAAVVPDIVGTVMSNPPNNSAAPIPAAGRANTPTLALLYFPVLILFCF